MKILIFTEGTILMHSSALNVSREERVRQSSRNEPGLDDFLTYIPNGSAVHKINTWKSQGAEIYYLTSRRSTEEIKIIESLLAKFEFPDGQNLLCRKDNEEYNDVAERLMPNILIEDDCESIGGVNEMTYPNMNAQAQSKIKSIVVKEFAGIDDLSDQLDRL